MESPQTFRVSGALEYAEFQASMVELKQFLRGCVKKAYPWLSVKLTLMIVGIVLCGLFVLVLLGVSLNPLHFAGYVAIWICMEGLLRYQNEKILAKIIFEHRQRYIEPLELYIDAQGLRFVHPHVEDKIGWPTILALREKAGLLMVFIGPTHVYAIPKRWFPDDATWEACLEFFRERLAVAQSDATDAS